MPTYDYTCGACGHRMEAFHSMSKTLRKCPECGRQKLERGIGGGAGIVFKGSGFYETDYRSDSYKQGAESAKKEAEAKADTAGSKEGKGDTKPAATGPSEKEQAD